jgi:hypothetical protein
MTAKLVSRTDTETVEQTEARFAARDVRQAKAFRDLELEIHRK